MSTGPTEGDLAALAALRIFEDVPAGALEELLAMAPPLRLEQGSIVFRQGQPADVALLVVRGRLVARVQTDAEDREVGEIRAGEIVGEQALYWPNGRRNATVIAREPSTCLLLSPDAARQGTTNPAVVALEQHVLGTLARRIRATNYAIHQAWKVDPVEPPPRPTLRDRLRALFGSAP